MTAFPLPPSDPASQPHWDGAARGQLLLQRCLHCGQFRFPAAALCSRCQQSGHEWTAASGLGEIKSFCTFYKAYWPGLAAHLPYTVVQVCLDEGVQMMSNLVDSCPIEPRIGMRVEARCETGRAGITLIRFSPLLDR